ncbi:hypothetical protein [uncultured Pseudodesulfovibrio sp.]|uniref:hypothetical protein n=1 Tax=uncultured Pseudodesulfovibrio sp. TaxID=2035858 RepID=UPI0029C7B805|nr:hypothetical protein [uncultured Pseudodesulfovibrio sp.]
MRNILIYIALLGIMLQAGCGTMFQSESGTPPFGSSVRMAVASQTANPDAGGDAPVVGLDGEYANALMTKYQAGPSKSDDSGESVISGATN